MAHVLNGLARGMFSPNGPCAFGLAGLFLFFCCYFFGMDI